MGLKGAGPFFQRSMANKVLAGYVTRICEIYIDDLLVHGRTDDELLDNLRKILVRLRTNNVTANPEKTELGLDEVEYVGHLISSEGTSFTPEKRLQVLDFPLPATQKALLQFIGLVTYFRDHVPQMTEMCKPLRELVEQKKYKGSISWIGQTKAVRHSISVAQPCLTAKNYISWKTLLLRSCKPMLPTMALVAICIWSLMARSESLDSLVNP